MTNNLDRILQTARLTLRPLTLDDAAAIFLAFQDAETMCFMDQPVHTTVAQTYSHLTRMLTPESCWWAIEHKDTDEESVIGFTGYLGNTAVPGMGYLLRRDYWRQGFMTEAVKAALHYGFTTLSFDRVELWINDGNLASQGLAKTVGFTRRSQFRMKYPHEEQGHDKVVYGLYRYEWMAMPEQVVVRPRACYGIQPILAVADVQATIDFYCHQLGFTVDFLEGDPPNYGAIAWRDWSAEGMALQLRAVPDINTEQKEVGLFLFVGPEIDTLCEKYRVRGVSIVQEPTTQPWGLREFVVKDCNGYLLRFGAVV